VNGKDDGVKEVTKITGGGLAACLSQVAPAVDHDWIKSSCDDR